LKFKISLLIILGVLGIYIWSIPANAWMITKEFENELAAKQAALKANPNDAHAHFDLAITYAYTNHIQDGWGELKKTVEVDPKFREKGLTLYIKKVTEDPNDWRLRFRLAFAYYFNDKKRDAIRELKNVLILYPTNVWAYGYISLIYGELGEIDTAMDFAKQGIAIDSNVAALHLLLSEGFYKKGDAWHGWTERLETLRLRALGY